MIPLFYATGYITKARNLKHESIKSNIDILLHE